MVCAMVGVCGRLGRMRTIVVIPTYNECDNIPPMAEALWALNIPEMSILIVDDNSPDGTADVAEGLGKKNPGKIDVLRRAGKMGLGTAYKEGFRKALDMGAEAIVQMDADFSH